MPTGMLNSGSGFGSQSGGVYDTGAQQAANAQNQAVLANQGYYNQSRLQSQQLGTQQNIANQQYALGQQGLRTQENVAKTQANASMYPATLQQQRYQQVFPYLTQALTGLGGAATGGGTGTAGASAGLGSQPAITAGGAYAPAQIQQQVNMMRAGNDASTQGQQRGYRQSAAGRGVGANSPLAQALGQQAWNANLVANTTGESQTRLNSAQANAQQTLASQQAREGQYASRQQESIQRQGIAAGQYNALLAALAGTV